MIPFLAYDLANAIPLCDRLDQSLRTTRRFPIPILNGPLPLASDRRKGMGNRQRYRTHRYDLAKVNRHGKGLNLHLQANRASMKTFLPDGQKDPMDQAS